MINICGLNMEKRAAMDDVLADINIEDPTAHVDRDVDMADVASRAVQKQEKQTESNAQPERKKKRRHGDMNGDANGDVNGKKSKKSKK